MEMNLTQKRGGAERIFGIKRRVFAVFFLMVGWTMGALELDLPFTDHAVLQARKVLSVWGKAVPGSGRDFGGGGGRGPLCVPYGRL